MEAPPLNGDTVGALLARLPHTRPVEVQTELNRRSAENDAHYTATERANLLGIGDGW